MSSSDEGGIPLQTFKTKSNDDFLEGDLFCLTGRPQLNRRKLLLLSLDRYREREWLTGSLEAWKWGEKDRKTAPKNERDMMY